MLETHGGGRDGGGGMDVWYKTVGEVVVIM